MPYADRNASLNRTPRKATIRIVKLSPTLNEALNPELQTVGRHPSPALPLPHA